MSEGEHRKLTAIMFTDLVGYSALAQHNEALALELLEEHRRLLRPLFPKHNGREVETAGDAFLVEFASALEAVRCAVEIQELLADRNRVSPPERAIHLRIGVHVGDVVHKAGKVMGDAVNIAARIQPLAKAGGVCVSHAVFEQVQNKLGRQFASLGVPELKNIKLPVTVYRVIMPGEEAPSRITPGNPGAKARSWMKVALPAVIIALVAGLWVWRPWRPRESAVPPASVTATPLTDARKLAQQARALIDDDPLLVRENYRMADELCAKAVAMNPEDGEIWATYARITCRYLTQYGEASDRQMSEARSRAERAIRLSPNSVEAGLAMADFEMVSDNFPAAERRLKALLEQSPTDKRVLTYLARSASVQEKPEECRPWAERADALPGGSPQALNELAWALWGANRYAEMEQVVDRSLARKPSTAAYQIKLVLTVWGWGEPEAGRAFLEQIPPAVLLEDRVAYLAFITRYWLRQADEAFHIIDRIPRDFIQEGRVFLPRDYLAGEALLLAGKKQAAEAKFQAALRVVEERFAANPKDHRLYMCKGRILAQLGKTDEASRQFETGRQLDSTGETVKFWPDDLVLLKRYEEAIAASDELLKKERSRWPVRLHELEFNPRFDPIRQDPRFQRTLARGKEWMQELRADQKSTAGSPDQSVAVLAFANLSEDKANEYFSDGISEELLNVLAKVPGLKVSARTSAFHFKGKDTPIPEIAKQLGVAYVVEGSVRKAGDKVRITAQLIKAADGFHVWSDTFTREVKDVFAVQDEIAGLVAQNLSLKLGTASPKATVNPEAFRLYLEGRKEWSQRTTNSLANAERLFTQAATLDPSFARAQAGLADVWMIRADLLERQNQDATKEYEQVAMFLDRALKLDPELAEAWATRGNYFLHKEKFADSEQAFQRALALNPNYATAHQWYGRLLFTLGKIDAGLTELELATRLDPLSPIIMSNYGMFLGFARRWTESLAVCDRALAIQPDFEQALGMRAYALAYLGRSAEALAVARATFKSLAPDAPPDPNPNSSWIKLLAVAGDRTNAARLAAPILAANPEDSVVEVFSLFLVVNRREDAFAYLERNQSRLKQSELSYLLDPTLDSVREDPRFLGALREAGLLKRYQDIWAQYVAWKDKPGQH